MFLYRECLLFLLGGGTYVGLEWLWRGFSHPSMFLLGGLCFRLIGLLRRHLPPDLPPLYPAVDSPFGAGRRRRLVLHGVSAAGTPVTASPKRPVIRTGITAFRGSSPATQTWT